MIRWNGQNVRQVWLRSGGSWRAMSDPSKGVFAKVDGVWRKAWPFVAPTPPIEGATITPASRQWAGSSGAFSATFSTAPVGGTGPFSYSWGASGGVTVASGQGSANVTLSSSTGAAGTVAVTITDQGSGTQASASAALVAAPVVQPLSASVSPANGQWAGAPGSFSSQFTVNASGGSGNYGFAWSVSGGTISAGQGTQTVTVASTNGAAATVSVVVSDTSLGGSVGASAQVAAYAYPPLTASLSPSTVTGFAATVAVLTNTTTVTAGGGSGQYSYLWRLNNGNGPDIVPTRQGTPIGQFQAAPAPGTTQEAYWSCRVTDNVTGLSKDTGFVYATITRAATLAVSVAPPSQTWAGSGPYSASATATPSGGSGNYGFAWSVSGGATITGGQGTASVTLSSATGAAATATVTVTDTTFGGSVQASSAIAQGVAPLTVTVFPETQPWPSEAPFRVSTSAEASGGTPPYNYAWNDTGPEPFPTGSGYAGPSKTWQSVSGRQDAIVSVVVTDALGRQASASGNITELG